MSGSDESKMELEALSEEELARLIDEVRGDPAELEAVDAEVPTASEAAVTATVDAELLSKPLRGMLAHCAVGAWLAYRIDENRPSDHEGMVAQLVKDAKSDGWAKQDHDVATWERNDHPLGVFRPVKVAGFFVPDAAWKQAPTAAELEASDEIENSAPTTVYNVGDRFLLVSSRGTQGFWKEWVGTDFNALPVDIPELGGADAMAHRGFLYAFRRQRAQVETAIAGANAGKNLPVVFTGHSLGGAVAQLLAASYAAAHGKARDEVLVATFGSPKVGNDAVAAYLRQTTFHVRCVYRRDLVPSVLGVVLRHSDSHHVQMEDPRSTSSWLLVRAANTLKSKVAAFVRTCHRTVNYVTWVHEGHDDVVSLVQWPGGFLDMNTHLSA